MCDSKKTDLIREFEFEHNRCQSYFDLMYKTLEFSFAAIVAIVVLGFGMCDVQKEIPTEYTALIFCYVLPVCLYVFGIMYAYNAYAMTLSGERAEKIHKRIYEKSNFKDFKSDISKYVISNRWITMFAYGTFLGFYIVIPPASIALSIKFFAVESPVFWYKVLPFILLGIYYIILITIILQIVKHFFTIKDLQQAEADPEPKPETEVEIKGETELGK